MADSIMVLLLQAGFGHDYRSVQLDHPRPDHLLRVLPRCFTEVMMRIANPLREAMPSLFNLAPGAPILLRNGTKGATAFSNFQSEMKVLLKELKARGEPEEDNQDIAAQLYRVMAQHPDISEDRILSEIGIVFVEGFETTGHTTSWTLYNIATVPGVQERLAAELDSVGLLAKPGCPAPRELEWEDLKQLPYLVGPYKVPANTVVATPLFAIQNTVHNWEEPEALRPERWLDVPVETFVHNSKRGGDGKKGITFMPFSEGPRNCVGQSLAKMEVYTLLAKLVANFRI
eukprot:jgi/Chrzof1/1058/Cz01g38230.t1